LARERLAEADRILRAIEPAWRPPPFDPLLVARVLGVGCVPVGAAWPVGALASLRGRPAICYRSALPVGQRNLTLFHELAHALFPDFAEDRRYWQAGSARLLGPDRLPEHLCDLAATEFLMPMDVFRRDLSDGRFGAGRVAELCRRYAAPEEAVCLRMIEADAACCALVFLDPRSRVGPGGRRWGESRGNAGAVANLRPWSAWAVPSPQFRRLGWTVPPRLALGTRSCIDQASRRRAEVSGEERWDLGAGRPQQVRVEAMPRPGHKRRRGRSPVLAFCYPLD
jgi:hypothetical protein